MYRVFSLKNNLTYGPIIGGQVTWTLGNISKKIGMSRSSFAERFKHYVGTTPMDYLTKWRMQRARDLLTNSDLSLGSISRKIGYTSEPAFNRAFKKQFNETPGALRRS